MSENSNEIQLIDYFQGTIAVKAFDQRLRAFRFYSPDLSSVNFFSSGMCRKQKRYERNLSKPRGLNLRRTRRENLRLPAEWE